MSSNEIIFIIFYLIILYRDGQKQFILKNRYKIKKMRNLEYFYLNLIGYNELNIYYSCQWKKRSDLEDVHFELLTITIKDSITLKKLCLYFDM